MPTNEQAARRHIRHRMDRQEATLQAFLAIEEMFDALDSQLKHSDASRLKFGEARRKLGDFLHAEIVRQALPSTMTEQLRDILQCYLDAGDDYLSNSTVAEKTDLPRDFNVSATLGQWSRRLEGWLDRRNLPSLRSGHWGGFLEKGEEGARMPAYLRDTVREVLEEYHP